MEGIQLQIHKLKEELRLHNHNYYILDQPTISDYEFDQKLKRLQKLEDENPEFFDPLSPTQRVGGGTTERFETENHLFPMYSLDNSYSKEDLDNWDKRIRKRLEIPEDEPLEYIAELKFDGASINLLYENGKLTKGLTRGDGQSGDNITTNIKTISTIPLVLKEPYPEVFEIRGEIVIPKKDFQNLNQARVKNGLVAYMNPRNTASGSLKLQDSKEVSKRPLMALQYGIVERKSTYKTHEEVLKASENMGFNIYSEYKVFNSFNELLFFIKEKEVKKDDFPFEIDGIVIKVNRLDYQNKLGFTSKSPRWAMAYKFETDRVLTKLESITYQVGRTGAVTPVANLTPVELGGTIVKRASLHNEDQIQKLDLYENDSVYIEKGGEIIPKVVGIETSLRKESAQPIEFITHCPDCGTKLIKIDAVHYCPNEDGCPPQIVGRIQHFIGRKAMDIEGIGKETVELLFKNNLIQNYSDLYELKPEQIEHLERMGKRSSENMVLGIEKSKEKPFQKVLFALGIKHIGETVAKKLASHFKSIDNLFNASLEEIIEVKDIGEEIAKSILSWREKESNLMIIERLKSFDLNFIIEDTDGVSGDLIFSDKTFLFTGKLEQMTRTEASELVEKNGGKTLSTVSKNLDYLIVGEAAGSKLKKAQQIETITILTEQEFLYLL